MQLSREQAINSFKLATVILSSVQNFYQQYVTHHFLIFSLSQEPHKKSAQETNKI